MADFTCPLDVNNIITRDVHIFWNEIVFNGRVNLNDVPSLPADIEIIHSDFVRYVVDLSRHQDHNMASVLKGSSKLCGIYRQLQFEFVTQFVLELDLWVVCDRRTVVGKIERML